MRSIFEESQYASAARNVKQSAYNANSVSAFGKLSSTRSAASLATASWSAALRHFVQFRRLLYPCLEFLRRGTA